MLSSNEELTRQIEEMEAKLDPTSGLPLNREELGAELRKLGEAFDNARSARDGAKLIKRGVDVMVRLKERAGEMGEAGEALKKEAAETYRTHFGDSDEETEQAPPDDHHDKT